MTDRDQIPNEAHFPPSATPQIVRLRAGLLQRLRQFLADRGFLEVETPLLSADTVVDRHIDPLSLILPDDPRNPNAGRTMWLQTSPEFHMKRMLATGEYHAIYQITRAFRAGERGPRHNGEFTIVEWYRVGDDMAAGMKLLSDLTERLLQTDSAQAVSYADAFIEHAGVDAHAASLKKLHDAARRKNVSLPDRLDREGVLDLLMVSLVEPRLGVSKPTILHSYPASQAALAKVEHDASGARVAQRFELYVDGVELANGYHELLDADELRRRNATNNELRTADGKPALPTESRLLAAMQHGLPACTGVALGFDRLVMVAAGATSIDQVLTFPMEIA